MMRCSNDPFAFLFFPYKLLTFTPTSAGSFLTVPVISATKGGRPESRTLLSRLRVSFTVRSLEAGFLPHFEARTAIIVIPFI